MDTTHRTPLMATLSPQAPPPPPPGVRIVMFDEPIGGPPPANQIERNQPFYEQLAARLTHAGQFRRK